jgi:mannose/cellobiose epimerase-like protein (N-acyl-D-glucosamine 2-epimerase family)
VTPYRGQNPNMHFCEAFIAAYEATGHAPHLDRAFRIADVLARQFPTRLGGFVCENYDAGWQPDWERRPRDGTSLEASSGVSPGHQLEWAKLLGILARHRDVDWLLPQAVHLYRLGWDFGWDRRDGGFVNGLDRHLKVEDARPSYWSPSEAIGGAAVLAVATGNEDYWADYQRIWDYALTHLVDAEHGGWFKAPALASARQDRRKGDGLDPDYHAAGACFEALRCLDEVGRNRQRQSGGSEAERSGGVTGTS